MDKLFTPQSMGSYAAQITEENCMSTSPCFNFIQVGIEALSFEKEPSIYPNPTQENISIDLGSIYQDISIQISDVTGKVVGTYIFNNKQLLDIQLGQLKGIYILKIKADTYQTIKKIVKQ